MKEFKVGDLVRYEEAIYPDPKVFQLERGHFFGVSKRNQAFFNELEPWKPIEGEWCWFWDKKDNTPSIGKIEKYHNGYYYSSAFNGSICEYCEPFIGELSSFLKDKR